MRQFLEGDTVKLNQTNTKGYVVLSDFPGKKNNIYVLFDGMNLSSIVYHNHITHCSRVLIEKK